MAYLAFEAGTNSSDPTQRFLEGQEPEPQMPMMLDVYRSLKLYQGRNGNLPFLGSGGYEDQHWLNTIALEVVIKASRTHEAVSALNAIVSANPQPPSPSLE